MSEQDFPSPDNHDELLPADGDDEITLAKKAMQQSQRDAQALHADLRMTTAVMSFPLNFLS